MKIQSVGVNKMNAIIPSFEESIFDINLADAGTEMLEVGIDSLINNPLLESIPITRMVIGLAKTAQNIYDRNLLIQTYSFAVGLDSGTIDEKKKEEYREKLKADPKYAEAELGRIIIVLNKTIDKNKSVILGRLYRAFILEEITMSEFRDLSEAVDGMFLSDIPF